MPMCSQIVIASSCTADRIDKLYILMNSLKWTKDPSTQVVWWVFVKQEDEPRFQKELAGLPNHHLTIGFIPIDNLNDSIHCPQKDAFHYARCLFPRLFPKLSKILWLDVDMVFSGSGIEDLWATDLGDYYAAACIDPTWQYCPAYSSDKRNTGTSTYINTGVLLMNLQKLRETGADSEIADWLMHWNERQSDLSCIVYDQTLINYLWKGRLKLLPTKYNNSLLAALSAAKDAYTMYMHEQGYDDPIASLNDAVILHFCGMLKPWEPFCRALPVEQYPYKDTAIAWWDYLEGLYAPPNPNLTDSDYGIYPPMSVTVEPLDPGICLSVESPDGWLYQD